MAQHNDDFDRIAALTSELEMMRLQVDETERGYLEKIKGLERELTAAQDKLRLTASTTQVDMVEHQAMRQELEGLRQTVEDLQRELDEATEQSQMSEDQLEDKNDKIERMSQEIDLLRGDMEEAEYKRRESDDARKQVEKSLYQLQEELDKANARAAMDIRQEESGSAKSAIVGALLGILLLLGGLEVFSFMQGKGELIALLQSQPQPVKVVEPMPSPTVEQTAPEQATAEVADTGTAQKAPSAQTEKTVASEATIDAKAEVTPPVSEETAKAEVPETKPVVVEEEKTADVAADKVEPVETDTVPAEEKTEQPKVMVDEKSGHAMIQLEGGVFSMGNRSGSVRDETPAHDVELKPFFIGQHEVTFDQYDLFATATGRTLPSDNGWGRGNRPVINVSWEDAQAYVAWLSNTTGKRYRLPTEAEWEYAAGSGSDAVYWWGYGKGTNNANCFNCGSQWDGRRTAPTDSFKANAFGLYSTAGNVVEWVQDCYKTSYNDVPLDGTAVEIPNCGERVARGGAFNKPAASMRTSKRARFPVTTRITSLGFRVARDP